jgi:hypothetical protein
LLFPYHVKFIPPGNIFSFATSLTCDLLSNLKAANGVLMAKKETRTDKLISIPGELLLRSDKEV